MSFGREAAPWGARFQAAADAAGRRLRTASERVADRAWYLKFDFVRACRSAWLVARERASVRVDALLWHLEASRQRLPARPAPGDAPERRWVRMAIGASLPLIAAALLAPALISLSRQDGSVRDTPGAHVRGDATAPAAPGSRAPSTAAARPAGPAARAPGFELAPSRPATHSLSAAPTRPRTPGSPPSTGRGVERRSSALPRLPDRSPTPAPRGEAAPRPVAPAPAPAPAPPGTKKPDHPAPSPPAQQKPGRPASPPAAQPKPEQPAAPPPAHEETEQPAAPSPDLAEDKHPHGGPPGQEQKEHAGSRDDPAKPSPGQGRGDDGRPDRP